MNTSSTLLAAARDLSRALVTLRFPAPVAHVYDPLQYAWACYADYVRRYASGPRRVVLVGMNPGPFGMMQTGVPFGEVTAVRDWLGIHGEVHPPAVEHPKRRIEGFACRRSEVSGRRLWGWAAAHYGTPGRFFTKWFVLNYCPLALLESSGRNFTPDRLPSALRAAVEGPCDRHLARALNALEPEWVLGIGGFAEVRLRRLLAGEMLSPRLRASVQVGGVLHPSPASPRANRDWAGEFERQLTAYGLLD